MKNDVRHLFLLLLLSLTPLFLSSVATGEVKGDQLYLANCAKCHGREGEGFLKLYPPIQNSRFLKNDVSQLPCIMRYGLAGKISVEGTVFNQIMPGNERLAPDEMKHIILSLQKRWNHPVSQLSVEPWLNSCKSH